MFSKLLLPIPSCVSIGVVGVAFTKYSNNSSAKVVDSVLDKNYNKSEKKPLNTPETKEIEFFYSVVKATGTFGKI